MCIPPNVLDIELKTIDGDVVALKTLIKSTTNEHVIKANYVVGTDYEGLPTICSFSAWTETQSLTLINTAYGVIMVCNDRNY